MNNIGVKAEGNGAHFRLLCNKTGRCRFSHSWGQSCPLGLRTWAEEVEFIRIGKRVVQLAGPGHVLKQAGWPVWGRRVGVSSHCLVSSPLKE